MATTAASERVPPQSDELSGERDGCELRRNGGGRLMSMDDMCDCMSDVYNREQIVDFVVHDIHMWRIRCNNVGTASVLSAKTYVTVTSGPTRT